MTLTKAGIRWLTPFLFAALCFAQDQSNTGTVVPATLIHRVPPDYPDTWKREGLQGKVHLRATIAKDGSVRDLMVIDGDALLAKSAERAVKKWRYKPATRNGGPVDVQTTIVVVFALNPVR